MASSHVPFVSSPPKKKTPATASDCVTIAFSFLTRENIMLFLWRSRLLLRRRCSPVWRFQLHVSHPVPNVGEILPEWHSKSPPCITPNSHLLLVPSLGWLWELVVCAGGGRRGRAETREVAPGLAWLVGDGGSAVAVGGVGGGGGRAAASAAGDEPDFRRRPRGARAWRLPARRGRSVNGKERN
ncbi:uncharacterized protein LOC125524420 [Triticum urartu]|uniref:uncharacterized protein LOC125524420 n=1 Tax=Triticum urartu TaxID=4572 RepID=UPI00204372EB|nr:uncharacterized protein LOC125524420 [Triticum urartu]